MTTMPRRITAGVDTHLDTHVVAALDERGALLGVESFGTTLRGYRQAWRWLQSLGELEVAGVEGTGSYGAGLTRFLHDRGVVVVEVDRPNRQRRRRRGKSDPEDAIAAARAAQSGDAKGEAKTRNGSVEAMRVLRVARSSARKARNQALNQMRSLVSTAPESIRRDLRDLTGHQLVKRAASFRPGLRTDPASITKLALRSLAQRIQGLDEEMSEISAVLGPIVETTAPRLVA